MSSWIRAAGSFVESLDRAAGEQLARGELASARSPPLLLIDPIAAGEQRRVHSDDTAAEIEARPRYVSRRARKGPEQAVEGAKRRQRLAPSLWAHNATFRVLERSFGEQWAVLLA